MEDPKENLKVGINTPENDDSSKEAGISKQSSGEMRSIQAIVEFRSKMKNKRKSFYTTGGVKATTIGLLTATLGPGLLAYPDAFQRSGVVYASVQLFAVVLLSYFSVISLAEASARTEQYTYGDIADEVIGGYSKYFAEFFFYANNFGASVSYFVLINQNMNSIMKFLNEFVVDVPKTFLDISLLYWVTLTGVFLIPVVMKKNLKDLKFLSAFGFLSIIYLAAIIVVYAFVPGFYNVDTNLSKVEFVKMSGTVVSSSVMLYSFQSHQYISLAYKELNDTSVRRMQKVVIRQIFVCTSIYLMVGVFGYITFADKIISEYSNFLQIYNLEKSLPVAAGIFTLTISLISSVPFCLRPCKESLFLFNREIFDLDPDSTSMHICFSLLNLFLTYSISATCIYFTYSLNQLISFVSAFTSPFMCFIFPFQFYIRSRKEEEKNTEKVKIYIYQMLSVFFAFYWFYSLYIVVYEN